ncbi:hypothetical protein PGB90_003400 [Kerria lacca]
MKRLKLCRNGINSDGKVILAPDTMEDLLSTAGKIFKIKAKKIFTIGGFEIDNIDLIRDDEILFISAGERFMKNNSEWITLNVGGKYFVTSRSTLILKEPCSMLAKSPSYFKAILNYLRTDEINLDSNISPSAVLAEAKYFGIDSMIPTLERMVRNQSNLKRADITKRLMTTTIDSKLRCQGLDISGADLSRLDLRYVNFKYANLRECRMVGTNFSYCTLERADISNAVLDHAQFLGVKMLCANLEGSSLKGCNFEDPSGINANMEGVNLKGANLEGSNMARVDLRVATLKNANLKHCDLRAAVLAGADLENCDLTGSNLQETNLRGANLKGASLELMQTPVHMSQTVAN